MSETNDITSLMLDECILGSYETFSVLEGIELWHIKCRGINGFSTECKKLLTSYSTEGKLCTVKSSPSLSYTGYIIYLGSDHLFYLTKENYFDKHKQ